MRTCAAASDNTTPRVLCCGRGSGGSVKSHINLRRVCCVRRAGFCDRWPAILRRFTHSIRAGTRSFLACACKHDAHQANMKYARSERTHFMCAPHSSASLCHPAKYDHFYSLLRWSRLLSCHNYAQSARVVVAVTQTKHIRNTYMYIEYAPFVVYCTA